MIGHHAGKPFKPNPNIPGGSKPGKRQGSWPIFVRAMMEAIYRQDAGTIDGVLASRPKRDTKRFEERMEVLLPGLWTFMEERLGRTDRTNVVRLGWNRPYKMYYSGTSDRGFGHDPTTRWAISREHWTRHVPSDSVIRVLHDEVLRGRLSIPNWRELAGL